MLMIAIPRRGAHAFDPALEIGPSNPQEAFNAAKAAFYALKGKIDGFVSGQHYSAIFRVVSEYEASFHDCSAISGNDDVVQRYLERASEFAQHVFTLLAIDVWALEPMHLRDTMRLLTAWQIAEEMYVACGYRAVSLDAWLKSCKSPFAMNTLPEPVFHLLLVKREPGEDHVLYADPNKVGNLIPKPKSA